jgi:hypothetical protein
MQSGLFFYFTVLVCIHRFLTMGPKNSMLKMCMITFSREYQQVFSVTYCIQYTGIVCQILKESSNKFDVFSNRFRSTGLQYCSITK